MIAIIYLALFLSAMAIGCFAAVTLFMQGLIWLRRGYTFDADWHWLLSPSDCALAEGVRFWFAKKDACRELYYPDTDLVGLNKLILWQMDYHVVPLAVIVALILWVWSILIIDT